MPIAFTSGEPSGIRPDIAIIYAQKDRKENLLSNLQTTQEEVCGKKQLEIKKRYKR